MAKLTIMVPNDSVIDHYLYEHPLFTMTQNSPDSVVYTYCGIIPPLAKISRLIGMFELKQYIISKGLTGCSFIVLSSY